MEQPAPGMTEGESRGGSRFWLLLLVLTLVLSVFTSISTMQQRQRMADMVDQLGDTSAAARAEAIDYLFNGSAYESGRLADSPRALRLLEDASASFSDAALAQLFDEVIEPHDGDWSTMFSRTPLTYMRSIVAAMRVEPLDDVRRLHAIGRLDLMLQLGRRPGGVGLVWDHAEENEKALIRTALLEIVKAAAADPDAHFDSSGYSTGLSLIGQESHEWIEPLFKAKSVEMRRSAWLMVAAIHDERARDAEWEQEQPEVAEAILVARVLASADMDAEVRQLRERLAGQARYLEVLDALEALPRKADGTMDLSIRPDRNGVRSGLMRELHQQYGRVDYARSRLTHFRHRDDTVYAGR